SAPSPLPAMLTVSQAVQRAANQFGILGDSRTDLSQGSIQMTGNDTDIALEGPGFIAVQTKTGLRYTRDGSFRLDKNRNLVTQQGDQVLSLQPAGRIQPIQIPAGSPTISPDGSISVNGALVARLRVEDFPAGTALQKQGDNYFTAPAASAK